MKAKAQWKERFRKGSRYWSGTGGAKGWCIFSRSDQYMLGETGMHGATTVRTKDGVRPVKRFGPFDSFDAACAAFEILGNTD